MIDLGVGCESGADGVGRSILTTCGRWVVTTVVMLGLLLTPVSCTLVDHPHSLFDTPDAVERSSSASHAAHASQTGVMHLAMMVNGAPPLAGAIPLPELNPGTVVAWLTAESGSIVPGTSPLPGIDSLPSVSSVAMSMAVAGQMALHVSLLMLLALVLIGIRQVADVARLTGQSLATIVPPPRRLAPL